MLIFRRFASDRGGNFPIIFALTLVPVAVVTGGAIDVVAHERARVRLQDTLDQAVLAAASLDQKQDAKALIDSYLKDIPDIQSAKVTVVESTTAGLRKVTATASLSYQTTFLKLADINQIDVNAKSSAQEARQNVELSLVLDISGSMLDNGGMTQLIPAAKSFLDVIFNTSSSKKLTSVNLIPFAGGVNIGKDAFNYLAGSGYARRHTKSSCFELESADFAAGTPKWSTHDQYPHFTYYNYNVTGKQPWWCPSESVAVTYMTNDLDLLKAKIGALQPYDGTGTAYGMKWAELLLNPSMKTTLQGLRTSGIASIPSEFSDRPAAFHEASTQKFIVLMSDGQIGFQPRPKNTSTNEVTNKNISASADHRDLYSEAQSVAFYKQVCTYAKGQGIAIFTIAFKVNATVAANIASCASDPSYAYKVDGLDMAAAFQSIATTIKKLRITE